MKHIKILIILVLIILLFLISQFIYKKRVIAPIFENYQNQTQTNQFKGTVGQPKIIGPTSPPTKD